MIAFRSSSTATAFNQPTVVGSLPAGVQAGDVMFAVALAGNINTPAAPSGWTLVTSLTTNNLLVWWKAASSSEPATYTFQPTTANNSSMALVIAAYSGVDPAAPILAAGTPGIGFGAPITSPGVSFSDPPRRVLALHGHTHSSEVSTPAGTTSRASISNVTSVSAALRVADFDGLSSPTDPLSSSAAFVSNWSAAQVVLRSAGPPNAPTNLSPSGAAIDLGSSNRFSWQFSDPDPGDQQSAYELRYRAVGTSTWTTTSGGATQYRDVAGGTFTPGDWEWQVRTTDNGGLTGPWSTSAFFTATTPPAGPTITAPTGGGSISTDPYTVTWTAAAQDAYQIRVVADLAGSPDTGTIYTETGTITSTTARSRSVDFATNNIAVHVQLRVQVSGLWSDWISVAASVSYSIPATPTVAVTEDDPTGAISVQATHPAPTGSQPAVIAVDWWRRQLGDTGDGIRIARSVLPGAFYTDWAVASRVEYAYRARAWGDNETSSWSEWTETAAGFGGYYGGGYD